MNKNENILTKDINDIKNEIQQSLKNISHIKTLYDKQYNNNFDCDEPKIKDKTKRKNLHIIFFIPILQFLDIKSLIELSKVNHLFYSFIYSNYFYRSVEQIHRYSNKKLIRKKDDIFNKKNIEKFNKNNKDKSNNKKKTEEDNLIIGQTKKIYSSFMSALTGALSYITPIPEIQNVHKEKNELEEIEKKIDLHDKLLNERIKQLKISSEIKETKAEIDKYIKEQYDIKKSQKKNEINKNSNNKNINDQTIKNLKREKYESEYKSLMKEINEYESQYNNLKKENDLQNQLNIDLEIKINKIRYFAKNIFKLDKNN